MSTRWGVGRAGGKSTKKTADHCADERSGILRWGVGGEGGGEGDFVG